MTIVEYYAKEKDMPIEDANKDFIDLIITVLGESEHPIHIQGRHCFTCELEKLIQDYENGCYEHKELDKCQL